ncbi:MAG TPA: hypothetical protein VKC66_27990 [Xanthobacteraceae bacterium]|nr:hypothetical protein [Xanthobacteraceae bacterium]
MKTMVACFLGLAALAMLLAGDGSPAYADALEAEPPASPILASGADGVERADELHCVLYSNGADDCIVNVQPVAADQQSTTVGEIDPSPAEQPPAVRFVDAIPVDVVQTVTIAAPGLNAGDREGKAHTAPMPVPATKLALDLDAKATTGAVVLPAGQSADAIVVAIVLSVSVAAPGQSARDGGEAASVGLLSAAAAPLSVFQSKATVHDNEE